MLITIIFISEKLSRQNPLWTIKAFRAMILSIYGDELVFDTAAVARY
jgi:hypothetical protein